MDSTTLQPERGAIGLPRIGLPAPRFEAVSTAGIVRLEDYKGSWLVLFSHPADFTPVCTTEFIAFSEIQPKLKAMNCALLGLSIDSVYSHIAWIRNIREKYGAVVTFPVIADSNREVATLYGMVMPGESKTEASRCLFIIDDRQILRAMIYYPLSTGRNMAEIVRVIEALQTSDKHGVSTPANWKPGEKVLLPAPRTTTEADSCKTDGTRSCIDWYYCTKEIG